MPPLKDDEKFVNIEILRLILGDEEGIKEKKGLKILAPDKLLTRLPILLAKVNAGNNSNNLKSKIRQILYF